MDGNKTRQSTTIQFPTYNCKLTVIIADTVSKEVNKLYKKYKIEDDFGDEAEGAVVMLSSDHYYLIIGASFITHNTIGHEIYHAAVRITEDRDITDEESQAWVAGHISGMIYKFLDKKKITIKHG